MIYTLFESMNLTINCFPFSLFLDNSACLDSGITCYQNVVHVFLRQLKTVSQFWRFLKMVWYSVTCSFSTNACFKMLRWVMMDGQWLYDYLYAPKCLLCLCEDHAYCGKETDIRSLKPFRLIFWDGDVIKKQQMNSS